MKILVCSLAIMLLLVGSVTALDLNFKGDSIAEKPIVYPKTVMIFGEEKEIKTIRVNYQFNNEVGFTPSRVARGSMTLTTTDGGRISLKLKGDVTYEEQIVGDSSVTTAIFDTGDLKYTYKDCEEECRDVEGREKVCEEVKVWNCDRYRDHKFVPRTRTIHGREFTTYHKEYFWVEENCVDTGRTEDECEWIPTTEQRCRTTCRNEQRKEELHYVIVRYTSYAEPEWLSEHDWEGAVEPYGVSRQLYILSNLDLRVSHIAGHIVECCKDPSGHRWCGNPETEMYQNLCTCGKAVCL